MPKQPAAHPVRVKSPDVAHILIIGAGFAGLEAAKILARESVHITLIDRCNHHLFQPLLYQVATAGLSPADIAMPIRSVLSDTPNTDIIMARVERIEPDLQQIVLDRGEAISYDYLILATGARHSYFGKDEWEALAPGLKTLEDAVENRRRILTAFEEAERAPDPATKQTWLTFVIVGAGPTGIELAGAIAELARFALAKDFNHINPKLAQIILVEAGPRILAAFPESLATKSQKALERLGVKVITGRRVTDITSKGVELDGKELIPSHTVIWAAGVKPSHLAKDLGTPLDRAGRAIVNEDLSIPGHPEIYVVGDLASVKWKDKETVPGVAPAAMQEGRHAARNILRQIRGEPVKPFRYINKGMLATIGRASAVADLIVVKISGYFAWLAWLFIHITYLIGFKNRLLVLIQWAWSYITFQRGTRLITGRATAAPQKTPPSQSQSLGH